MREICIFITQRRSDYNKEDWLFSRKRREVERARERRREKSTLGKEGVGSSVSDRTGSTVAVSKRTSRSLDDSYCRFRGRNSYDFSNDLSKRTGGFREILFEKDIII